MTTQLPEGFTVRAPTMNDLDVVTDLMNTCTLAIMGRRNFSPSVVGRLWADSDFHLETDAWVITAPDRSIVGYADFSGVAKIILMWPRGNIRRLPIAAFAKRC